MTKSNGLMRTTMWGGAAALALGLAAFLPQHSAVAEDMKVVPPPKVDVPAGAAKTETAVLAGGCFWGVQGVFQHVKGVKDAVAGYTGGAAATALYPVVSTGTTGHAESVRITYDPQEVSYGKLLQIYFSVVTDPTTSMRRARTRARNTARTSSRPMPSRRRSRKPMSPSCSRRTSSARPSSPR